MNERVDGEEEELFEWRAKKEQELRKAGKKIIESGFIEIRVK